MGPAVPARAFDRFIVIVLDSVGCGDAPDAAAFGDSGANTLARVIQGAEPRLAHLARLGLDWVPGVPSLKEGRGAGTEGVGAGCEAELPGREAAVAAAPAASWGRMTERSGAKDTMSGHWELMGVVSEEPFPLYPEGFPDDVMRPFARAIGRATLGNVAASGIRIIDELGDEHVRSGAPIIYTSGDSVFQVAAHEEVIPLEELYRICETARAMLVGDHRVARVIARPFVGSAAEGFKRTHRRRDLALPPPSPTVLDRMTESGYRTLGVGKIHDIFSGRGLSDWVKTTSNADGVDKTLAAIGGDPFELVFTNLVDFDSDYGHRRDVEGYARALEAFDGRVPELIESLRPRDCLILTADHGNDPGFPGTDHTRERVPLLVYTGETAADLGTRASFADLGATVLDNFAVDPPLGAADDVDAPEAVGTSFLDLIRA